MTLRLKTNLWIVGLLFGVLTGLAGVFLVGVSSWFLAAVALAGLGPAALIFNFHFPAAAVRLLALIRTAGKYGERVAGHEAALQDQAHHREELFRRMAASKKTRARGWQLAKADELEAFLGDVEADDFESLRYSFPVVIALIVFVALVCVTAVVTPLALTFIAPSTIAAVFISDRTAKAAALLDNEARLRRGTAGRDLGRSLTGLVSLDAAGDRDDALAGIIADARKAEGAAVTSRLGLARGAGLVSLFGPLAASAVMLAAWWAGARDDGLLMAVFVAFSWLALGELVLPLGRHLFAHRQAQNARSRLGLWARTTDQTGPRPATIPEQLVLPLMNPRGERLGNDLTFPLVPGKPVAVLGPSGCGKTTALKQLAGWLPWLGPGDHPFGSEGLARLMTHYSLHDAVILRGTVRDNLFAQEKDDVLWDILTIVELNERVSEAGGLDAIISQETWSLGEARRLQLARALLSDAAIVLLDEPGEHLRDDQAARILERCFDELKDRRVLFVTHQHVLANLASVVEVCG
ncbi:MAG: ATP-binding cassette domain-containing protein [Pseudomonadota bacterium]